MAHIFVMECRLVAQAVRKVRAKLGAPAHFAAAELLIRWNRSLISVATRSFMQA
jgi:hypothetical protein